MRAERVAVLFSGGTDSTLAAALLAEHYEQVHLVTYDRLGLSGTDNTRRAARDLQERFGEERFLHAIIPYDAIFKHVSYERYARNLRRHGLFLLSTCGLCKLAMHARTIVYCLESDVRHVADGANKGMDLFPAQMEPVLAELRGLYDRFGVSYSNPVFDYEPPAEDEFIEKQNLALIRPGATADTAPPARTAGHHLRELDLAPSDNIKGTAYDRERQARCFQFILFNVFVKKWYLQGHSVEEYRDRTVAMFKDKIEHVGDLIEAWRRDGSNEKILKG